MLETVQKIHYCWVNTARNRFFSTEGRKVGLVLLWPNNFVLGLICLEEPHKTKATASFFYIVIRMK